MAKQRLWIAMLAIPTCFVFVFVTTAERSHPASASGAIDPTCSSSLPCIEYDNNSNGPGIRGVSLAGNGLIGFTKFNSTSAANGRFGIGGNDLSTAGSFNSGVKGISVRGSGVSGQSTSGNGVLGQTTSGNGVAGSGLEGVVGSGVGFGTSIGIDGNTGYAFGSGGMAGVQGTNNKTSTAIRANGFGGLLFDGNNSHSVDVFTVDDGGNLGLSGGATIGGVVGIGSHLSSAVSLNVGGTFYGVNSVGSLFGVVGYGGTAGVQGEASNSTASAVRAFSMGGLIYEGLDSSTVDVFEVDNGGNVHAHSFTSDLSASNGQKLVTYAPQASQPIVEDFGEAELTNGSSYVHLESRFASTMAEGAYLVFITPEGDNRGLYVSQKSATGFAVRESQGGHSTLAFSYRIVAKPLGNASPRLPVEVQRRVPKPTLPRPSYLSAPHVTKDKNFSVVPTK